MWPKSLQPACFSDVQWPYFTPKFSFIAMSSSAKSAMLTAVWFLFQSGMEWASGTHANWCVSGR